jgi:uncharacterized protein (DUF362 family)
MNSFLHIVTLKERSAPDSLNQLSKFYDNLKEQCDIIGSLLERSIDFELIKRRKVLLKPNWVRHSKTPQDDLCLRTHDNFLLAVLTSILQIGPNEVVIGDAPIQGCKWDQLLSEKFLDEISSLSRRFNTPVYIKDFRRRTFSFKENLTVSEIRPISDYVIFDLGDKSWLEPVTKPGRSKFRVTHYDPNRMIFAHSPGIHKYCIAKDYFDADIVISLPKIKTHEKTGITGALKNLVGINGDKDFLPHHRIGGTGVGGDCYPGRSFLRYLSELSLDESNRKQGTRSFWYWQKLTSLLWFLSSPGLEHNLQAGWHGNDTCWRMVLDLNRIAEYGLVDGTIADKPQRQIFSLCDGIVGGQGNGPLNPLPLPLGIVSLSNNSSINDIAMAILMRMPCDAIPLLRNYTESQLSNFELTVNGMKHRLKNLENFSMTTIPPVGWQDFLKDKR